MSCVEDPAAKLTPVEPESEIKGIGVLREFFEHAFELEMPDDGKSLDFNMSFEQLLKRANVQKGYTRFLRQALPPKTRGEVHILDLGCGPAPLLAALLQEHGKRTCNEKRCRRFGRVVHYLGVDQRIRRDFKLAYQDFTEECEHCFPSVRFRQVNLSGRDGFDKLGQFGKFDLVTVSNTFHELQPQSWIDLLSYVPQLLNPDGIFLLLDLGLDARFPSELWRKHFRTAPRFWEASAIWISRDDAVALVKAAGLIRQDDVDGEGQFKDWWWVTAKLSNAAPVESETRPKVETAVRKILKRQVTSFHKTLSSERQGIGKLVQQPIDVIPIGLRYLAMCGSQCIRCERLGCGGFKW